MIQYIRKLIKNEDGNVLVETSLVIPMLLGLFMGVVFFTIAYRQHIVMNMAVQEGARYYEVSMGDALGTEDVLRRELALGGTSNVDININSTNINLNKDFGFNLPFISRHLLRVNTNMEFHGEIYERYYKTNY